MPSVRYTKLTDNHTEEKEKPCLFTFPQGSVGSFYPPMFECDKPTDRRLASPHSTKLTRIVMDQPKSKQPLKNPYTKRVTKLEMEQPSEIPKWRLNSPHANAVAKITGMEPSTHVQHKRRGNCTGVHKIPTLQFSLEYDVCHSVLMVHLMSASNLPAMDHCGTSDPFVDICLFPNQEKQSSKVITKSLNPIFNQKFFFRNVYPTDIGGMILHFNVYDYDKLTKNDKIGNVIVFLDDADLSGTVVTFEISKTKLKTVRLACIVMMGRRRWWYMFNYNVM